MIINLFIYLSAFLFIWFGSGFIVSSVDKFSKRLRLSSFAISFIVLGLFTSTPEFAVGLQSVADGDPEIFIGNLLGGIPVIFLFIIPILAILGNGISLKHEFGRRSLLATLLVILSPSILLLDGTLSKYEGVILIFLYVLLLIIVQRNRGFFSLEHSRLLSIRAYSYKDMLKVIVGLIIVFISSNIIVDQTLYFADALNISAFYIGLIVVSLGTNIPELSLAVRSVFSGRKDVAFGDYMGSAAANTLAFGIFTLLYAGKVATVNNFYITFFFVALSLILFFYFSKSKNNISRKEGLVLLVAYTLFLSAEFLT